MTLRVESKKKEKKTKKMSFLLPPALRATADNGGDTLAWRRAVGRKGLLILILNLGGFGEITGEISRAD